MAKPIMIQGVASGVGKTILTIALCRIFKQDGYNTAPFKAQNMTTNTCLTKEGEGIAVSAWLQAMAAGVEPSTDMSPIVIKPPFKKSYSDRDAKLEKITTSYNRLSKKHDVIVIEGAGSPVELNLNKDDIINMGMAKMADAPVLLVGDIDRGGVFASLFGTLALMSENERARVKATIINRFYGDPASFNEGVKILKDITKLPVAGVVPFMEVKLPEEDGLSAGSLLLDQKDNYEAAFDKIAENVRNSLDMGLIYKVLG